MYSPDFWTLWEKARVGWSERIAMKHAYYQVWKRSPAQVGCMRQVLRVGALGRPSGMGQGGRWEGGSGWGTPVNPWPIHVNIWQKPLQYCKVINLQLIKINEKKKQFSILWGVCCAAGNNQVNSTKIQWDKWCGGVLCVYVCAQSLSCVWLFATPWTVACQASLNVGFPAISYFRGYSRPEDWTCLSCISYFGMQILDLSRKAKKWWQMDSLPQYHLGSPVEACTEHKMGTENGMSNLTFAIWESPLTYFQMFQGSIDLFTPTFWCSPYW